MSIYKWWRNLTDGSVDQLKAANDALWVRNSHLRERIMVAESTAKDRDDLRRIVVNQRLELYRLGKLIEAERRQRQSEIRAERAAKEKS